MKEITIEEVNNGYIINIEYYDPEEVANYSSKMVFENEDRVIDFLVKQFVWDTDVLLNNLKKLWSK